jgi:predicted phage tail protein
VPPAKQTAPGRPTIRAASAGNALAIARWTAPADRGGAQLTRFEIQVIDSAGRQIGGIRTAPATASALTITGLVNGTPYRLRVRAVNAVGAGAWSATSAIVQPRTVPGAARTLTTARGAAGGRLTAALRWKPPATTGGAPVTAYRISCQRLSANGAAVGTPSVTTASGAARAAAFTAAPGARAGVRYRCTVRAVNAAGAGTGMSIITKPR